MPRRPARQNPNSEDPLADEAPTAYPPSFDAERSYVGPSPDIFGGKGWWHLLWAKPDKAGTMPAGFVLAIMVFGMVGAMFVNADATLRKSNAKCADCWRHTVADAVAFSAGPLKQPRAYLDDVRGVDVTDAGKDSADVVKQAEAERAAEGVPAEAVGPKRPVLRKPTPEQPLSLWVGGDSITGAFGPALQKVAADSKLFKAVSDSKPSSGLTRPDYFNWPKHLYDDVVKAQNPDVMVIMFGANDAQNMPIKGNQGYVRFTKEWLDEYRRRVADTMDLLKDGRNQRVVIWMGAPVMGPNSGVEGMDKLNYIYASEAKTRPWVVYFDTSAFLSNPDGSYAANLPNAEGTVELQRAGDNIHLNQAGSDRVAWAVLTRLSREVDLSAVTLAQPPDIVAPPSVVERPEIARPADWPDGAT